MLLNRYYPMDMFERGDVSAAAASVSLPGDAAPAASGTSADDAALGNQSGQAQTETNSGSQAQNENKGAATTGADPLAAAEESDKSNTDTAVVDETADKDEEAPKGGEAEKQPGAEPDANADVKQLREWGKGLKADVDALRPVVDTVQQLGGIERMKGAAVLLEAYAAPDFKPENLLGILAELSPQRYAALLNTAITNNQDAILQSFKLNPQQFKIAAKAVLEGRPVNADDISASEIPYGMPEEDWEKLSEETQQSMLASAKATKEANERFETQKAERLNAEVSQSQENWAKSIDASIDKVCDSLNIASEGEGAKTRERIRREVYSRLTSEADSQNHFYSVLKHYTDKDVKFAEGLHATVDNFVQKYAAEEAEYATKVARLESEVARLKLSGAKEKIEVPGDASVGELSVNKGVGQSSQVGGIPLDQLFNRESIHQSASSVISNRR